jgi:hypothetical protein
MGQLSDKEKEMLTGLLKEAGDLVAGERNESYGHPKDNHQVTAELWTTWLGLRVTPRDVCIMMILLKISREHHTAKRDNLVDLIGYTLNAAICGE